VRETRFKRYSGYLISLFLWTALVGSSSARDRNLAIPGKPNEADPSYHDLRVRVPLNADWRFKRQAAPGAATEAEFMGAEKPGYDDSSWAQVWIPHTWDVTPDNPFTVPGHFRGIGWYRTVFNAPGEWRSRNVWVDFKGVFQIADVWVNGHNVGRHVGGYTGFQFDVTDFLKWSVSNLLVVRVNDVLDPDIAPTNETNVAVYGGIYRSVSLFVVDPMHVLTNGTWVTTKREGMGAVVRFRAWLRNQNSNARQARLETALLDALGQRVATIEGSADLRPNEEKEFDQTTHLSDNVHFWSPDTPYLYRAVSMVWDGTRVADRYVTPFGIRFIGYDPQNGYTLNGAQINLHGVNRRQDYGFLGDAVPEAVGARDIRLIKEMGANFLRTSHYPQDPAVLDACDQFGILVWEEIPNIKLYMYPPSSEDTEYHSTERFSRSLMENLKQQLREMIERDRNHPAIIIWGLADDLSDYAYPEDFVELHRKAHELDATRWTAGRAPHVTDIMDANSTPGFVLEHAKHPERMYILNEWGAFPNERGREGLPLYEHLPVVPQNAVSMSDSDASMLLEGYRMQWDALPWLGTAKWCMFDPSSVNAVLTQRFDPRDASKVSLRWPFNDYRGVADMWRLPKSAYYFLQSQWTEKPMVHIVGHWTWPTEVGRKRTVRVYSNCNTVELFLNGQSLGVRQPATPEQVWRDFRENIEQYKSPDAFNQQPLPGAALRHPPFIWDDVSYEPRSLVAVGEKNGITVRDELRTAGAASQIVLSAEKAAITSDGLDVCFIEADVQDAAGVVVPNARPWIRFTATGPGRLLGGTREIDAISGMAAINLQSTGHPGEIVVTATSPGLSSGSWHIRAVEK
jgi:beta-galactosidase